MGNATQKPIKPILHTGTTPLGRDILYDNDNKTFVKTSLVMAWVRLQDDILHQQPVGNDTKDLMKWYEAMTSHNKEGQFRFYLVKATNTLVVAFDPLIGLYLSETPIDTLNTLTPEQIRDILPAQVDTENKELRLPAKARGNQIDTTHVTFSIDDFSDETQKVAGGGHAVAELQALKRRILQAESARGEADFELRRHFNAKLSTMM